MNVDGVEYDTYQIRNWARKHGWAIGDRGRIPSKVLDEFQAEKRRESQEQKEKIRVKQEAQLAKIQKPVKREPVKSRKVSARRLGDVDPSLEQKVKKPGCPIHKKALALNEEENIWKCLEEGCVITAFPKNGATKPSIGRGKLTLYRDDKNCFYLRADNGISVEITQVATNIDIEQSMGRGTIANVYLTLYLE